MFEPYPLSNGHMAMQALRPGYSSSAIADSDDSFVLDSLPSGVYKFTVTYPDNTVYTLDNYAVWPSSSSSYTIKAN
jgi:hypothetical protein